MHVYLAGHTTAALRPWYVPICFTSASGMVHLVFKRCAVTMIAYHLSSNERRLACPCICVDSKFVQLAAGLLTL